jgi:hypothetical protein
MRSHHFFCASKALWKSFPLMLLSTACDSLWMSDTFKMSLQFHFEFGKQSEISRGKVWRVQRMGNEKRVIVSHKLCGFQGRVGGRIVMEPVVVAPKFPSFLSHIFFHVSQNITVKVRVNRSVRRNKFRVNNQSPSH